MTTKRKIEPCPKCGSSDRELGRIFRKGTLEDIRFRAVSAGTLSMKQKVDALVCHRCGFLELYLAVVKMGEHVTKTHFRS